jgi:3,4-dihydroxy 2-butanone 4-phosphate synthase / GTP cyclohydrolase II
MTTDILKSISPVPEIIAEIAAGRIVVIVDDEDRENEGDLLMAADFVTPQAINFMATHGRGLICLTLTEQKCAELGLAPMVRDNRTSHGTAFTASIEAATGVTTGISAADRARTVQVAVARNASPHDIVQPGHIFPLTAKPGGVLTRAGHTEAGCDLASLAQASPAAVICEILRPDGEMARLPDLVEFAKTHGLKIGTIADLIKYRAETERLVTREVERKVNTPYGAFKFTAYKDRVNNCVHYALSKGEPSPAKPCLVRVHAPFQALDWFEFESAANQQPATSFTVPMAMRAIAQAGEGILILLSADQQSQATFDPLARLVSKDDNKSAHQGTRWDPRTFGVAAQIMVDLKVGKIRALSRPHKIPSLAGFGLEIVEYVSADDFKLKLAN